MLSNLMRINPTNTVTTAALARVRNEVVLLPVFMGLEGTRVPNGSGTTSAKSNDVTNAGTAGIPGYPDWSHPV